MRVTLVLGRLACDAALAGRVPAHLHDLIRSARQFPEGRAVRLELHRLADVADVEALVAVKLAPAAAAGASSRARGVCGALLGSSSLEWVHRCRTEV